MEDFVSFELAKKLKEKGFREESLYCYRNKDGKLYANPLYDNDATETYITTNELLYSHNSKMETRIDAPTISQVLKWLREEKDIDLAISPVFFYDDVLGKMREYECEVFTPPLNKPKHCGYHKEWEQTALAGIEYVLYDLI
jgi:hypothetical protein